MHNRRKKKRSILQCEGFTLAESLMAVLILMMASLIVAASIPAARNAYDKVILTSNAETLLSTTITALRNELSTARNIEISGTAPNPNVNPQPKIVTVESRNLDTIVIFYSSLRDSYSALYLNNANDEIMLMNYYNKNALGMAETAALPLISSTTATNNLFVTYSSVTYESGIITFKGLAVNQRNTGKMNLAEHDNISIRVL